MLFVGSGCAALYEVVWLQLLQLVIGSLGIPLGVLLGMFMGGMCLGSLLLPRRISGRHHLYLRGPIIKPGLCNRHLLRSEKPCCNARFTILILDILVNMPAS